MHTKPGQKEPSLLVKFVSAGLAASVAEAATIPIDTAKVRLQVSWSLTATGCLVVLKKLRSPNVYNEIFLHLTCS